MNPLYKLHEIIKKIAQEVFLVKTSANNATAKAEEAKRLADNNALTIDTVSGVANNAKSSAELANGEISALRQELAQLKSSSVEEEAIRQIVNTRVQEIVGAAPEALDTLEEIATALGDSKSVTDGIVSQLGDLRTADTRTNESIRALETRIAALEDYVGIANAEALHTSVTNILNNGTE